MIEPFGPEYVRPPQPDCPNCPCCSVNLCERGRSSVHECRGLTSEETREAVHGCPCSAATTPGTHAHKLAKIRVVRLATEMPLPPLVESLLRALVEGEELTGDEDGLPQLRIRGLVADVDGRPAVTDLGRFYLRARGESRFTTSVEVRAVDWKARTVEASVVCWQGQEPVTVLLDQVLAESKLPAEEVVPGLVLEALANCGAELADDLVLTDVRPLLLPGAGAASDAETGGGS